jgi:hypothetical protein
MHLPCISVIHGCERQIHERMKTIRILNIQEIDCMPYSEHLGVGEVKSQKLKFALDSNVFYQAIIRLLQLKLIIFLSVI